VTGRIAKKGKHIPQRTCVGCRLVLPKRTLIRVVRVQHDSGEPQVGLDPQSPHSLVGVAIDTTGKMNGRGAYLHNLRSCWEKGLKGPLAHALRIEFTESDRQILTKFLDTLPTESAQEESNREAR
jgi:predicted RNA-binding protein YlxR (DUF448 family)